MRSYQPSTQQRLPWPAVALEAALYLALTIAITWPLGRDLTTNIPGEYADPLLVQWIMAWVMKQLTAMLTGDAAAVTAIWHAPIFFPERNTLALSEHFTAQAVQALPVWWMSGNPILSYNAVFLLSFVLTGLGTSLLVQELTGSRPAGGLAGIMAAFNPYRLALEVDHLHVLCIQWLPLALLGLHRFIRSGSTRALAFAALCVIALNLSSGYFMLYCAPFIVLFALADMVAQRKVADYRLSLGLSVAAVCIVLITTPFVIPYLNMQRQHDFERPVEEVDAYSAGIDQYAASLSWLGVILVAAAMAAATLWRKEGRTWRVYTILFLALALFAFLLTLGPVVRGWGQPLGWPSLYQLFYDWMPGFKGLRVVSRYAALLLVFLSVAGGLGVAVLVRIAPRAGRATAIVLTAVFLWQSWPSPFELNSVLPSDRLPSPPGYLTPGPTLPAIYKKVAGLEPGAVIAEFPFGDPWYELRYMFFAATHGKRLMNGYSGFFPASYVARRRRLADPLQSPAAAADALNGATHVVVHERAWNDDTGQRIEAWLESVGAVVVAEDDGAKLLTLNVEAPPRGAH